MHIEKLMKSQGIDTYKDLATRAGISSNWMLGFWQGSVAYERKHFAKSPQLFQISHVTGLSIETILDAWYETRWSGWVYIFQQGNIYKIGRSWNPDQRFRGLMKKHQGLINLHSIWSNNMRFLEYSLQRQFSAYRDTTRGREWFILPRETIEPLLHVSICEYKHPSTVDHRF